MYKDYENGYDLALSTYTKLLEDVAFKAQVEVPNPVPPQSFCFD